MSVVTPPTVTPASSPANTGVIGNPTTLVATAYAEPSPLSGAVNAEWQVNTGSGFHDVAVEPGAATGGSGTGYIYTSNYTFTPQSNDNNTQYQVIFTTTTSAGGATATTLATTLSVIPATTPVITLQPQDESVLAGTPTIFIANASGPRRPPFNGRC